MSILSTSCEILRASIFNTSFARLIMFCFFIISLCLYLTMKIIIF
ncbi:hypothetical protein ASZ90_007908 [hydrocarbon metagenome]|uniref:Uncharacterized protein n=1 Tax=hydrocarbon metagenome TaxID=938273 RepID=A0A0W8FN99_9ZZZZ